MSGHIEVNKLDFLRLALEQERTTLEFLQSAEIQEMGLGMHEDFLNEKRKEIEELEEQISVLEEKESR